MKIAVYLCGLYSIGLAVFHVFFWKLFRWKTELAKAAVSTRAIIQIANLCLIYLFIFVAFLCFAYPEEIAGTPLGSAFIGGMGIFWVLRTLEQFIFLRYNTAFIHTLTAVFALGAFLHFRVLL